MEPQEFDQLLRRIAHVAEAMNQSVDALQLMSGRLETRIEQHDQVLERQDQTLARLEQLLTRQMARQDATDTTLLHMEQTLTRLDRTLEAFLHHLQHPSGNGREEPLA